jgi:hypothetical protein
MFMKARVSGMVAEDVHNVIQGGQRSERRRA